MTVRWEFLWTEQAEEWCAAQPGPIKQALGDSLEKMERHGSTDSWINQSYFDWLDDRGDCCFGFGEIRFTITVGRNIREKSARPHVYRAIGYRESEPTQTERGTFVILLIKRKQNANFYRTQCPKAKATFELIERGECPLNEVSIED